MTEMKYLSSPLLPIRYEEKNSEKFNNWRSLSLHDHHLNASLKAV